MRPKSRSVDDTRIGWFYNLTRQLSVPGGIQKASHNQSCGKRVESRKISQCFTSALAS